MGTIAASDNEFPKVIFVEGAAPGTPPAGFVYVYAKADGRMYGKDDTGTEFAMNGVTAEASIAAHLADTSDAHDASAVSVADAGNVFTATDVEAVLAELQASIAGGGIPATTVDGKGELIVGTANDTVDNLAAGTNGQHLVAASGETTGVKWTWEGSLKDFGFIRDTSGDISVTVDNGYADLGISDITLTCATGDIIEVGLSLTCNNSTAVVLSFDCVSMVGGSPVNSLASGAAVSSSNFGASAWRIPSGATGNAGGSIMYTAQAGDITSATIVLRIRVFCHGTTNRTVDRTSARPIHFWAKNLGPAI